MKIFRTWKYSHRKKPCWHGFFLQNKVSDSKMMLFCGFGRTDIIYFRRAANVNMCQNTQLLVLGGDESVPTLSPYREFVTISGNESGAKFRLRNIPDHLYPGYGLDFLPIGQRDGK